MSSWVIKGVTLYGEGDPVDVLLSDGVIEQIGTGLTADNELDAVGCILLPGLVDLHTHLRERPVEGIDLQALARATEGLTGADLSHVCDSAAENALMDSVRTGRPRLMNMQDMYAALKEVRPSSGPWFETARAVVEYADVSGEYAELREWMKRHRML